MARTAKTHNLVYLHRDRGYRWQDRDPQMEELCDIVMRSELSVNAICRLIGKATGGAYQVSHSTIDNWLSGKTRRPQNMTMNWVGYALGYERKWTRMGGQ